MFEFLDWSILGYAPLLFGISGAYETSEKQESQESGLSPAVRAQLGNLGSYTAGNFVNPFLKARLSPEAISRYQLPGLTSSGLFQEQQNLYDTGFNQAVTQALSRFSGNQAARGFLNSNAVANIAGSAAQHVAPQFAQFAMPVAGQNILNKLLVPEQLTQASINQMIDFLKTILGVGGGTGVGSASSFGVQAAYSPTPAKPTGTG
jgi:hypothetical protein